MVMTGDDRRFHALVVDDEAPIRRLIADALEAEGFTCELVGSAEVARELLVKRTFHAIVTDLMLSNRLGYGLATDVLDRARRPVVVVVTGMTQPGLAKDLLARGVDDVLFKPLHFELLAAKVRRLVERRIEQLGAEVGAAAH
jgi:DNA-binding response OmpR family regulator